jgi:hypothetical protein
LQPVWIQDASRFVQINPPAALVELVDWDFAQHIRNEYSAAEDINCLFPSSLLAVIGRYVEIMPENGDVTGVLAYIVIVTTAGEQETKGMLRVIRDSKRKLFFASQHLFNSSNDALAFVRVRLCERDSFGDAIAVAELCINSAQFIRKETRIGRAVLSVFKNDWNNSVSGGVREERANRGVSAAIVAATNAAKSGRSRRERPLPVLTVDNFASAHFVGVVAQVDGPTRNKVLSQLTRNQERFSGQMAEIIDSVQAHAATASKSGRYLSTQNLDEEQKSLIEGFGRTRVAKATWLEAFRNQKEVGDVMELDKAMRKKMRKGDLSKSDISSYFEHPSVKALHAACALLHTSSGFGLLDNISQPARPSEISIDVDMVRCATVIRAVVRAFVSTPLSSSVSCVLLWRTDHPALT